MAYEKPKPLDIKTRRIAAGLTQKKSAELVKTALRTWEDWEAGRAEMHAGLWDLYCIRTPRSKAK